MTAVRSMPACACRHTLKGWGGECRITTFIEKNKTVRYMTQYGKI